MFKLQPNHVHPAAWCIIDFKDHPSISPCIFSIDKSWRKSTKVVRVEEIDDHYIATTKSGSIYKLDKIRANINLESKVLERIKNAVSTKCTDTFSSDLFVDD